MEFINSGLITLNSCVFFYSDYCDYGQWTIMVPILKIYFGLGATYNLKHKIDIVGVTGIALWIELREETLLFQYIYNSEFLLFC